MKTIDLKKIIDTNGLNEFELANELFPMNKHPRLALSRVLRGDAVLDANQISKLAVMLNVGVSALFQSGWSAQYRDNVHTITSGIFRAELDTTDWTSRVYVNGTIYHEVVLHDKAITLSDYIANINKVVEHYKNQNKHESD